MKASKNIGEMGDVFFVIIGLLFGAIIMSFIFAQLGPDKSGLTESDPGYNESLAIQNNSLVSLENYSEQSKTQFTTIGITITLAVLLALFGMFVGYFRGRRKGGEGGGNFG